MGATKMPGFSAEVSLYSSGARYENRFASAPVGTAGGLVEPALPNNRCECYRSMGGPVCCCNFTYGNFSTTSCCDKFGCY